MAAGLFLALGPAHPVAALTDWSVALGTASSASAAAGPGPSSPVGVAATCSSLLATTVQVTWAPVTGATAYGIDESDVSATSGFSVAASGVTGTTWTSGSLPAGSYWFEVSSFVGADWQSAPSVPSGPRTITLSLVCT